jgi:hypothetical protein
VRFAPDSPLEGDGFELPVREHRAMAPSHGFAATSHREAALRGAPASHGETAFRGAAGFREARRHAVHPSRNVVLRRRARPPAIGPRGAPPCGPHCEIRPGENVTWQYLSHGGRPAPAVRAAATVRPAAAPSPTAKSLPLAPAGTASNFAWSGKKTGAGTWVDWCGKSKIFAKPCSM